MVVESYRCDAAIIGAGAVGLAIARRLALAGHAVVLLEKNAHFGMETSSRNSEVIHAGLYYPAGSLKAALCARGREMLYAFCAAHGVPHRQTGKLVVAQAGQADRLAARLKPLGVVVGPPPGSLPSPPPPLPRASKPAVEDDTDEQPALPPSPPPPPPPPKRKKK